MIRILVLLISFFSLAAVACEEGHELVRRVGLSKSTHGSIYELKIKFPVEYNGNRLSEARFFLRHDNSLIIAPAKVEYFSSDEFISYITIDKESYSGSGFTFHYGGDSSGVISCGVFVSYYFRDLIDIGLVGN